MSFINETQVDNKFQQLMREVFIISTGQIVKGKTAGSQRVMNVARSLAAGNVHVYLCSFAQIESSHIECCELSPGISYLKSTEKKTGNLSHLFIFLSAVHRFIKNRNSENVVYLYPTTIILKDFIYLIYFKIIKGYNLYCDINELRAAKVFSSSPPSKTLPKLYFYLKSLYDYFIYRFNEIQIPVYDGIVVISTNLEKYFKRKAKRIVRIPILCDTTKINEDRSLTKFNGSVFKICFAGFIDCDKEGFDIMFEALHEVNIKTHTELYLYGDLPENENKKLKYLTDIFLMKGKVFYMGNIEPDMLLPEFIKYHLLILPRTLNSQTKYGFSTKLSDYLISGVPALITDVSDNALFIKDNLNGFLISAGSSSRMANKIVEIIINYNLNSDTIRKNAFQTARDELDNNLYTQTFINFFFHN
jgi:glycosyltransferase involved in cell wall biosynthesis